MPEQNSVTERHPDWLCDRFLDRHVIVRTHDAGVWFGILDAKCGREIILRDARRMWRWWAAESISLSPVSIHGIKRESSKICEAVPYVWLCPIEILPCSLEAIESIGGAEVAVAE